MGIKKGFLGENMLPNPVEHTDDRTFYYIQLEGHHYLIIYKRGDIEKVFQELIRWGKDSEFNLTLENAFLLIAETRKAIANGVEIFHTKF